MPAVVFFTHIPLLRLAEDEVPFAHGELTRLPWEQYDMLSQRAFSDFRSLYEQTAPVFYRVDMHGLDEPPVSAAPSTGGMVELSAPSSLWAELLPRTGLGLLLAFADNVVTPAWLALLLAAPAAAPAWPRLSVSFAVRGDEQTSFGFQGRHHDGVRVDGDAGQQLLFAPRAAGAEISRATVERADAVVPLLDAVLARPELSAALRSLAALAHPSLSPPEQTTLAVVALEALLLPEVTSGLGQTFARRVATLLAPDDDRGELEQAARALYDARSASLHGGSTRSGRATGPALAQRLLAAAVEALAAAGGDVGEVCAALDDGRAPGTGRAPRPADPVELQAPTRLAARTPKIAAGFSLGGGQSMAAEEGKRLSWSPLVGLSCDGAVDFGGGSGVVLVSATPEEVLSIEDKDVRRELANLLVVETPVACLGVGRDLSGTADEQVAEMLRTRDLAVVALRLAGFHAFSDPELLGSYVYESSVRTIDTTVLAPSILRGMGAEPKEELVEVDVERLAPAWSLVGAVDGRARHDDVDHVLTLFRRAHDARFLPPDARAGLLLALVEAMLGRFRPHDDPVQLEDLVRAVAGDDPAADWFAEHGRAFRNDVAHGRWDHDPEPLETLLALQPPLVGAYLRAWLDADDRARRPGRVFVESVAAGARG